MSQDAQPIEPIGEGWPIQALENHASADILSSSSIVADFIFERNSTAC